jgi:hypothetical protein
MVGKGVRNNSIYNILSSHTLFYDFIHSITLQKKNSFKNNVYSDFYIITMLSSNFLISIFLSYANIQ